MTRIDRFQSLDAWRGVCALLVAAMHLNTTGLIQTSVLISNSYRFVDFFFVLSGFVICSVYREKLLFGGFGMFMWRRIGRLLPLHAAVVLGLVVMAFGAGLIGLQLDGFKFSALPLNLALVHGWGMMSDLTWNGPSWSISTEMFAYGLFGLMAAKIRSLNLAMAGVAGAALAVILLVAPEGMGSTYDFGLARCLLGFMSGALVASLWLSRRWRPRNELIATLAVVAGVVLLPQSAGVLIVPVFAYAVLVFASGQGHLSEVAPVVRTVWRLG